MYTAGSEKFGWPTHIIDSANKPNYMVITFPPPLPPGFPLMQHYSFLETYTPLFIWEQLVKTDTSSDIRINVYSSLVTHPTGAYLGFLSMK